MSAFDDWWKDSVFATEGRQSIMHPDALHNEKGYLKIAFNAGMERALEIVEDHYSTLDAAEDIRKEVKK